MAVATSLEPVTMNLRVLALFVVLFATTSLAQIALESPTSGRGYKPGASLQTAPCAGETATPPITISANNVTIYYAIIAGNGTVYFAYSPSSVTPTMLTTVPNSAQSVTAYGPKNGHYTQTLVLAGTAVLGSTGVLQAVFVSPPTVYYQCLDITVTGTSNKIKASLLAILLTLVLTYSFLH